ncbi:MAG TPA: NAD(+)/NADH kinase [Smithellaceae bacterium]|mgnify:FL=1|nr:NAD(+)/NADH kinase [Syntrophaceae bacterium]NMD04310.1 NAD(+) kinase [Deltaproteobacteria bacterium]HOF78508.1 NAD(+)/NADH kinase [Smithellaceae bacterium]MBP8609208.1 NAD(+)/NADH kinase [Syntrophaceae bacterium]HOM69518.1 NAD(+)/NADH kinase [Smithellaceae bacterium]
MKIRKIGMVANVEKAKIAQHVGQLKKWLEKNGAEVFLAEEIAGKMRASGVHAWSELARKVQLLVVLGGDGTMLRTARHIAHYNVPIVGINMGSFGYLTEVNLNEMHAALDLILQGKFAVEKRMMLSVSIKSGSSVIRAGEALNDVVINRGNLSRITELETEVNGEYLTTYKADGLIISTPTGSTAYSLSAGGPIVFPEEELIIINPICPHTLTNRPIIFPQKAELVITLWSQEKGATVTLDGQETYQIKSGDSVMIKKSRHAVKVVLSPHRSYWEILRSKLSWSGLPSGSGKRKNAERPEH